MSETKEHQLLVIVIGHNFLKRKAFNAFIKEYYPHLADFVKECWKKRYLSTRPYCYISCTKKFMDICANQAHNQTLDAS